MRDSHSGLQPQLSVGPKAEEASLYWMHVKMGQRNNLDHICSRAVIHVHLLQACAHPRLHMTFCHFHLLLYIHLSFQILGSVYFIYTYPHTLILQPNSSLITAVCLFSPVICFFLQCPWFNSLATQYISMEYHGEKHSDSHQTTPVSATDLA